MIRRRPDAVNKGTHTDKPSYRITIKTVIPLLLSCININLAASLEPWTKSRSLMSLLLFYILGLVLCFLLTKHYLEQEDKRLKIHSLLWGGLMTTAYVLGCRMRRDDTALSGPAGLPLLLTQIICLSVFAAACIAPFLQGFPELRARMQNRSTIEKFRQTIKHIQQNMTRKWHPWQAWLFSTLFILLCWTPVFLAYYPSVFAYDAEGQLYQVLAHDYSTHHPLLHTIFLGAFFQLGGGVLGSYSAGMAVHSVVQMALMACVFGYTLSFLHKVKAPICLQIILLLFYALFPANSILALSTTKDVLYSALVLLHTLFVYRLTACYKDFHGGSKHPAYPTAGSKVTDQFTGSKITVQSTGSKITVQPTGSEMTAQPAARSLRPRIPCTLYILWTALMLLFRNNALYALAASLPVIYIIFRISFGRGNVLWRRYFALTVMALILFAAGGMGLKASLNAHNGSPREMLSIPLQQMARTRVKAEETLSDDMRQELEQYIPGEWVFAAYNPYLADPVKNRAVIHDNPAGLIKTWVRLGLMHPQIYIDAFLDNSIGYWFLEDRTHAQIYGLGTESGFGYLSTDNRTMPAGCEIIEHSYLPGLRHFMERIVSDNEYQKIPVVRILFAPAFYWWLLCLYMAIVIYKRKYPLLLPVVFLTSYYLTLLLSPTVLIRYMYPFVVTVPVLCCLLFCRQDAADTFQYCKIHNKN